MKTMRLIGLALVCSLLILASGALAQTNSLGIDVVTIQATIPDAYPPDQPGLFTITRQGSTNLPLYGVIYHIGGTASNGVDYAQIPSGVTIPAGSRTAYIFIQPRTNSLSSGDKTVELQIVPSPLMCPSPVCGYDIGSPSNATVVIHFSTTNAPPYVQLNSPSDGATFAAPATIPLQAYAVDREDGFNLTVEFFEGTNSLGFGVFVPTKCASPYCPFFALTWSNAPPGAYVLTAKATDSGGALSFSQPVHILVTPPQTNSLIDGVTIQATIPDAYLPDQPGLFTITRQGSTNYPLYGVIYHIGGTASNAVDYAQIPSGVTIPAGSRTAYIFIQPKTNSPSTGDKTVELQILPSPLMCPSPECGYDIGSPSNATVVIHFSTTNAPPHVQLNSPSDGATFAAPATIPLRAYAVDREDGFNLKVEFFNGTNSLGFGVFVPAMCPSPYCPFFALTWSNVPPGAYVLTAKATDSGGASSISQPVHILVTEPQTNPIVRIISPADKATFRSPVNIPIYAYAAALTGSVVSVEFLAGTNDLGAGHIVSPPPWVGPTPPQTLMSNLWTLTWSNASVGPWPLTAVATDNAGASAVSPPVTINVLPPLPPPPPPTNLPVVIILALDPIAIEGTNCFPWRGLDPGYPPAAWPNGGSSNTWYHWFTNCGPRNALFAIRRFGNTNGDLTVSYAVGGTATNGVDYVALPGSATIPARHPAVLIPLVPLDDGPPDITSTVILKLVPGSAYTVGFPSRAAAIILDPPLLPPPTAVLPDQTFHLRQDGPDGAWFHVEATSDLINWTALCTNQVLHGAIDFIDPDAPGIASRFYRAVPESQPPQ